MATKPNLLYYCAMSLAFAELLLKQTGDASLDRAREKHRHHGLTLSVCGTKSDSLVEQAAALVAKPVSADGRRIGTFEQWHKSARDLPLAGKVTELTLLGTYRERFQAIASPKDEQLHAIPKNGISLLDCLKYLPDMANFLAANQITPDIIRGRVSLQYQNSHGVHNNTTLTFIVNPGPNRLIDEFFNNWVCHPSEVNYIECTDIVDGGIITVTCDPTYPINDMSIPSGSMWNSQEVRIWPKPIPLN